MGIPICWYCHLHAHLLHMIISCNFHHSPSNKIMPFHTSPPVDQGPIHAPSTCSMGLDPCARHSLFWRTYPYYTLIFYSSCGLQRPAATLASPLFFNCTVLPVPLSKGPYLRPVSRIVKYESFVIYDTRNWPLGRYGISIYVRACVRSGTLYLKGTRKEAEIYANSRTCCIADNSSAAYNRLTC